MTETNWPELLTRYSEKRYVPKANQGYTLTYALVIRADGKDLIAPKGSVLRFDHPGLVSIHGKVAGGTDFEVQLSAITLVEERATPAKMALTWADLLKIGANGFVEVDGTRVEIARPALPHLKPGTDGMQTVVFTLDVSDPRASKFKNGFGLFERESPEQK